MRILWRPGGVAAAAIVSLAVASAQAPAPTLAILEPKEGDYISGQVLVRAELQPPGTAAERVLFFADGRLVCTVEASPYECAWNAGDEGRPHHFRVVAVFPGRPRVARVVRTSGVDFNDGSGAERVAVTVTVMDGGRFVKGLGRKAFRVYDDGRPQPIDVFDPQNNALELVIAIDISETMVGHIDRVKDYVKSFLSRLRPKDRLAEDRVTLVVFNRHVFVLTPPSVDLAGRLRALDRLAPWEGTSLHEAIVRSFDLLGREKKRRGLIVFSDGDDSTSRITRDAVERRSETSDAVLYMIGQGRAVTEPGLKGLCERLADRSGGQAFFPRTMEDLGVVFESILEEMSNQYLLTYPVPAASRDATFHRIRVEVDGGYQVRARQGYRLATR